MEEALPTTIVYNRGDIEKTAWRQKEKATPPGVIGLSFLRAVLIIEPLSAPPFKMAFSFSG
jgi:hypothetical protein